MPRRADAYHITAPAPGGAGAIGCMELALEDAGITAADVAHINAHGTSTPLNDLAEAEAIEKLFGRPGPPVTSIKGVTGHSLGAAGAIEAVACALTIERRLIPPTVGLEEQDPEIHLDIVPDARPVSANRGRSCRTASVSAATMAVSCSPPHPPEHPTARSCRSRRVPPASQTSGRLTAPLPASAIIPLG